jgi:exopolysaccharide production repressor protein
MLVWGYGYRVLGKGEGVSAVVSSGTALKIMNVVQFLVGMLIMSSVVATSTYWATGSIWKALGWTFIAVVVLEVGQFVYILWVTYGPGAEAADTDPPDTAIWLDHGSGICL